MTEEVARPAFTGIAGLDDVLAGGFQRGRLFLIEGSPGTGKTTIATQFLMEGARVGERVLYITLSETEDELRASAESHGWTLSGVDIHELVPPENLLNQEQQQSLLYSSDLELGETTRRIFDVFDRLKSGSRGARQPLGNSPAGAKLAALSAPGARAQALLRAAACDRPVPRRYDLGGDDKTVHSIAHGCIRLEELAPDYGPDRRRLRILKYRGRRYRGGFHDFKIETGGVRVFPRLVSAEHKGGFRRDVLKSHSQELNALLGGGIERGSSVLILGPAGTGKSLLTLTFLANAIDRGERAAMFVFDEEIGLLIDRSRVLGIDLQPMIDSGAVVLMQIDAAELTPGEFSERVRECIQERGARTIILDSLNGYLAAMPGRERPYPPYPRAAAISEPPGGDHLPDRRPARAGRPNELAGGCHLSCRHRHPAALLRGEGARAPGDLGDQEADGSA